MTSPADESRPPVSASPISASPVTADRSAEDLAVAERMLGLLRAGGDTRVAKVRRVRQSVRTHTYENDLKLSVAVDRVARELGR